jgi:hypothetical protein
MNVEDMIDQIADSEEGARTVLLEPRADFDPCVLGSFLDPEADCYRLVYSEHRICEMLVTVQGMCAVEAAEHYSFNVAGAYLGPGTPVFVDEVTA